MTRLIKTTAEIKSILSGCAKPVGFVATMGALHAGHISLISAAKKECKTVVVSIFVNPLQFGPNEDLKKYPRDLKGDLKTCEENNVDIVFAPDENDIFPSEDSRKEIIKPPDELAAILCGKTRPMHFQGVATIVKKLFDILNPDISYWGEKDLQQIHVIRWLVKEYKLPIALKACPTIREKNGLASSSRNRYLTDEDKEIASNLYKSLKLAKDNIRSGIFTVSKAAVEGLIFLSQFPQIKVEYFEARDKENLNKVSEIQQKAFIFY